MITFSISVYEKTYKLILKSERLNAFPSDQEQDKDNYFDHFHSILEVVLEVLVSTIIKRN